MRAYIFFGICTLGLALGADAQGIATRVQGKIGSDGYHTTFNCSGEPVCVGTYLVYTGPNSTCSNVMYNSGDFEMSGLNLESSFFRATIKMKRYLVSYRGSTQGTCTFINLDQWGDYEGSVGVNWDGKVGTFIGMGYSQYQSFTAVRDASPPIFPLNVYYSSDRSGAILRADLGFRPEDIAATKNVYAFAVAPAPRVFGGQSADAAVVGWATSASKVNSGVPCVLAQLSRSGQMTAVTAERLLAYLNGVTNAASASISILSGAPVSNVEGATVFVGYGSTGESMFNSGVHRNGITFPSNLECRPSIPQTGWWWNPREDGRGYSIEVRGNRLFFASFLYDVTGRSTWFVANGPVALEGGYFEGDLLSAAGGQPLDGQFNAFPTLTREGAISLSFHSAAEGTLVWPGGTVPIQRFDIVPNGTTLAKLAGQPENGWWWNEEEPGRGFFLEFQGATLDIAGYMYDEAGKPVWYLTVGELTGTPILRSFSGNWWRYGDGQTLYGTWRQNNRLSTNVAPVSIRFTGTDTAEMTLPNNRTTSLKRHRF